MEALDRRIFWEEKFLYPIYDDSLAAGEPNMADELRQQHARVKVLFAAVCARLEKGILNGPEEEEIRKILEDHDQKEEKFIYPSVNHHVNQSRLHGNEAPVEGRGKVITPSEPPSAPIEGLAKPGSMLLYQIQGMIDDIRESQTGPHYVYISNALYNDEAVGIGLELIVLFQGSTIPPYFFEGAIMVQAVEGEVVLVSPGHRVILRPGQILMLNNELHQTVLSKENSAFLLIRKVKRKPIKS